MNWGATMIDQSHLNIENVFSSHMANMKRFGSEYKGACPLCGGKDRFVIKPGANGGVFMCRHCHPKFGDCIEAHQFIYGVNKSMAMIELGLSKNKNGKSADSPHVDLSRVPSPETPDAPIPDRKPDIAINTPVTVKQAKISKRGYTGIQDYLDSKGVPLWFAEAFGWKQIQWQGGAVISMEHTEGQTRIRHLSEGGGFQPVGSFKKYCEQNGVEWSEKYQKENRRCFYKFTESVNAAIQNKYPLVLCNGQPSVLSAHYHGVNAFAQTDGEKEGLQNNLLIRLVSTLIKHKLKIIIALDGDEPGRKQATEVAAQLAVHGIDAPVVDFGGNNGYDLGDFCQQHESLAFQNLLKLAQLRAGSLQPVVDNDAMSNALNNMLEGNTSMRGSVIKFPLATIANVGGFAKYMLPGMMTYIYGKSGAGKTITLETMVDKLLRNNVAVFWWSPEWTPTFFKWRQIQRSGAATFEQLLEHSIGVKLLSDKQRSIVERASDKIDGYGKHLYIYQTDKFTEDIIARMIAQARLLRRNNPETKIVCIFDYAQRMKVLAEQKSRNAYEVATDMVKTFCEHHCLHSIMTVQIEKSLKDKPILGMYDAQWVRPDYANLILTLNIKLEIDNKTPITMKMVDNREHNILAVNIAKNSMGQKPIIDLPTDYERLRILDAGVNPKGYTK
jgi:hypothetical protein